MRHSRVNLQYLLTIMALLWGSVSPAFGQVISSGITGIVMDEGGKPVSGATVSALHTPTGTNYTAVSRPDGRFNFRSLIVGGPYSVSVDAAGFKAISRSGVTTQLGSEVDVDLRVQADSEIVQLAAVTVEASSDELDSTATGAGTFLGQDRLAGKPTTQRSLADLISASPQVTLRASSGDREESQITALGQNARFNSIMIDGARINDQFGLNYTGLASFFNPLSLDTIEQISVAVSPYDVRQSGFTGATINAVTKSGTNRFSGSAYYLFSGDEVFGLQMQGEDIGTLKTQNRKFVPKLERTTWGATFGGPIWKNKLFFFTSYEKFEREQAPSDPGFTPNASELTAISAKLALINTTLGTSFPFGAPGGRVANFTEDEKLMAKIDWNIVEGQRFSVRYSTTEGSLPQYGSFTATTGARGVNSSPTGPGFTYDSYFYAQERKEEVIAGQLLSQWSPDFKTELKYSTTTQDQLTPTNSKLPLINILNVPGTSQSGTPITGIVFIGTEFSRHGNEIFVDTESYSATGEYFLDKFIVSGGFDREQSDFSNLFRSGSYGQFDFNSSALFTAGTIGAFNRGMYDPSIRPAEDLSEFAVTGFFLQTKWDFSPRLSLTGGLRYDMITSDSRPLFNQRLFNQTGFRNDGTVDGTDSISPRIGFNLSANESRSVQVRGGFGRFLGRAPWVMFSNSYNQLGVGTFTNLTVPASLESYLINDFNPASPIGKGADNPTLKREVDWTDEKLDLPSVWRGNIAVDYRLPVLSTVATVELVQSYNDNALFIKNENLKALSIGADGRQRYSGNPGATNNTNTALYTDFLNLYHITNTRLGESRYLTVSLDRAMKNNWAYNLSYTNGRSTEAQAFGATTAGSQWGRNAVFVQNSPVKSRSDFEIRNRVQLTFTRQFEFFKGWRSLASLYYEGRSGNPYSFVYRFDPPAGQSGGGTDLNGDGVFDNDLVAVPTDVNDPRFDFSAMSAADRDAYFTALNYTGLSKYAGSYAPRNAFKQPWVNRLDLRLSQTIPIYRPAEVELFLDFTNFGALISEKVFGYLERATLVESDTYWRRSFGSASYNSAGKIVPVYAAPSNIVFDNGQSRWRLQVGARVKF